jgi:hypothetical protein
LSETNTHTTYPELTMTKTWRGRRRFPWHYYSH